MLAVSAILMLMLNPASKASFRCYLFVAARSQSVVKGAVLLQLQRLLLLLLLLVLPLFPFCLCAVVSVLAVIAASATVAAVAMMMATLHTHVENGGDDDSHRFEAFGFRDSGDSGASNIGASIIRIGFWGPSYCNYYKEPPQNSVGNY